MYIYDSAFKCICDSDANYTLERKTVNYDKLVKGKDKDKMWGLAAQPNNKIKKLLLR